MIGHQTYHGLFGTRKPAGEADGHEPRFAVNHLAQVLLTRQLVPLLSASAPTRIVNRPWMGSPGSSLTGSRRLGLSPRLMTGSSARSCVR